MRQHLYVHIGEAHHGKCIRSKPTDEMGKIAKSSKQADVWQRQASAGS
jgi:hypothetical protein